MKGTVYTVGHGARTLEDLLATLEAGGIGRLVDVRRFPASRRHPQFGREALAEALGKAGLEYRWEGETLGGRRKAARTSRHPAWRVEAFRAYADYMDTPAFREALGELEKLARRPPPLAFMCAETLWWKCHRRLIADALSLHGFEVIHLLGPTSRQPHKPHPALRAGEDGFPIYDVGVEGALFPDR